MKYIRTGKTMKATFHLVAAPRPKKTPANAQRFETRKYKVPMMKKSTSESGVPIRAWANTSPSAASKKLEARPATSLRKSVRASMYMNTTAPTPASAPGIRQPTGSNWNFGSNLLSGSSASLKHSLVPPW